MNIAIDARMLGYGPMHGIARYVFHLLRGLNALSLPQRFFVFTPLQSPLAALAWKENFTLVPCTAAWISVQEQWQLPRLFKKYRIDLFHSPSFVAAKFSSLPQLLTVHDLNHLALPEFYSRAHRFYYEWVVKPVLRRSSALLTVSQYSRDEICRWLDLAPERVVVTYNGVSADFCRVGDPQRREDVREHYQLPSRFIFCLGSARPHKNNAGLIEAFCLSNVTLPLVISTPSTPALQVLVARAGKTSLVKFIPYIDDHHLPIIYSMADLFVFPSLYEGFGLPALEAMACACPVLVSEVCSLPEIVGDLGYYLNPRDPARMSEALERTLRLLPGEDPSLRQRRINHARTFSWERLVHDTVATYLRFQ